MFGDSSQRCALRTAMQHNTPGNADPSHTSQTLTSLSTPTAVEPCTPGQSESSGQTTFRAILTHPPLLSSNSVPCSDNSLTTTFKPNWWNSTLTAQLQLQITESDQPVWATTTGLGPAFGASWNGTTPASATPGNGTQSGVSIESIRADDETGGLASGKLAAAVTVPLLA